jgi:hypothetical protein
LTKRNDFSLLSISVLDVNDHKPVFDQNVYYQNMEENVQLGTTVVTIRAKDDDQGINASVSISGIYSCYHSIGTVRMIF